ncbi:hypothetical protein WMY93_010450 [Mugilogobius chulae]|uniref:Non-selective voltage-gated ion channel VDAC2 n=1 Tax=Mugilogobius chulae TaxID=88201 RepID=A0AAW0PIU3_9GOBI
MSSKKNGKVRGAYKREYLNVGIDVDLDFAGPTIHGAGVAGYEGWLAGYQMTIDSAKSKMTHSNIAVGYRTGDFQLHTNVKDGSEFGGSIYQKVNDKLETAVDLAWSAGSNGTCFGIAAKYQLDPEASISAKVNNASLVGIGYSQNLRPGMKLVLSALVDGKNINAGGHKPRPGPGPDCDASPVLDLTVTRLRPGPDCDASPVLDLTVTRLQTGPDCDASPDLDLSVTRLQTWT